MLSNNKQAQPYFSVLRMRNSCREVAQSMGHGPSVFLFIGPHAWKGWEPLLHWFHTRLPSYFTMKSRQGYKLLLRETRRLKYVSAVIPHLCGWC